MIYKKKHKKKYKFILAFLLIGIIGLFLCACTDDIQDTQKQDLNWKDMSVTNSLALQYAEQFTVDYYEDGYALITIAGTERYLVIPEEMDEPDGLDQDITVLHRPFDKIYLAATSAMDLIRAVDGAEFVAFSGTKAEDWYIEEARTAMENGDMLFAGKYSAPDFELLLDGGCNLAIESTMILHNPEIKEQLEAVGIPVLVERSSYEQHPLGRMEWIKLYGVLFGKEQEACDFFDSQAGAVSEVLEQEKTDLTVAFFYVTPNGSVNVRKAGDYVAKMIELAGGEYVFSDLEDENENALSTMTIQMEEFYSKAKDADYLIYNSTIAGTLPDLDALYEKSDLFRDFKAVQNGNVFCTEQNMFQESTGFCDMILDIHSILMDENVGDDELKYLYRLR